MDAAGSESHLGLEGELVGACAWSTHWLRVCTILLFRTYIVVSFVVNQDEDDSLKVGNNNDIVVGLFCEATSMSDIVYTLESMPKCGVFLVPTLSHYTSQCVPGEFGEHHREDPHCKHRVTA